jgi:hypothetical protein
MYSVLWLWQIWVPPSKNLRESETHTWLFCGFHIEVQTPFCSFLFKFSFNLNSVLLDRLFLFLISFDMLCKDDKLVAHSSVAESAFKPCSIGGRSLDYFVSVDNGNESVHATCYMRHAIITAPQYHARIKRSGSGAVAF